MKALVRISSIALVLLIRYRIGGRDRLHAPRNRILPAECPAGRQRHNGAKRDLRHDRGLDRLCDHGRIRDVSDERRVRDIGRIG